MIARADGGSEDDFEDTGEDDAPESLVRGEEEVERVFVAVQAVVWEDGGECVVELTSIQGAAAAAAAGWLGL